MTTIQATVIRLAHDSPTGWAVLNIEVDGQRTKAVGNELAGYQGGQTIELEGDWHEDKWGRQFKASSAKLGKPPTSGTGLINWLAQAPGIGPSTARAIVEHFGDGTLDEVAKDAQRLEEVPGIGKMKAKAVARAIGRRTDRDRFHIELADFGIAKSAIAKVLRRFGDDAPRIVRQNPFVLLQIRGLGFKTVDPIARALGVTPGSYARIKAGVIETLFQSEKSGGHCYLPAKVLLNGQANPKVPVTGCTRLLALREGTIGDKLSQVESDKAIVIEPDGIYLSRHHNREVVTAGRLAALVRSAIASSVIVNPLLETAPKTYRDLTLSKGQSEAVLSAGTNAVTVITGGPGTGKSEITRAIVDLYQSHGLRVALAAPTGRAAKRLAEATGHHAKTIHRLLEYQHGGFQRNRSYQLDCQALIVDEFSMVDIGLAASLFDATPDGCRVVIVGDVDQLPSVGPGIVLSDIITSGSVPVVRLHEIFRQAAGSRIIETAHDFVNQRPISYPELGEESDFYFLRKHRHEDIIQAVSALLSDRIPSKYGLDPMQDVMVLTPQNKGPIGTVELNRHLQQVMNPSGKKVGINLLRVGDRVMQVRNNYDLNVFNGDIGRLRQWSSSNKTAIVELSDGRLVTYTKANLGGLVTAYASTVHKFQGSQTKAIIGIVDKAHSYMLRRNTIYTMITRAEKLLILIGQRESLEKASRNTRDMERYTHLAARLANPPTSIPRLGSADTIVDRVLICEAEECMHTWSADSPQVFECPECGSTDSFRVLDN